MNAIGTVIAAIPPAALPIVVCIIGIAYLYFKFGKVERDRAMTKKHRDADSQEMHDLLLKHTFQIDELKGHSVHHEQILDDLNRQISLLNTNIAKLQVTIEAFGKK